MRRRPLLIVLVAMLVPTAAWAGNVVVGDGTLSVRNGNGFVRLELDRGVVIGRIGAGKTSQVSLYGPKDDTCQTALVWELGEQLVGEVQLLTLDKVENTVACVYRGDELRFRLLGSDADVIRVQGENISLSAVGRGRGQIKGRFEVRADGSVRPDGTWSLNGAEYASLPDERQGFKLAATNPAD